MTRFIAVAACTLFLAGCVTIVDTEEVLDRIEVFIDEAVDDLEGIQVILRRPGDATLEGEPAAAVTLEEIGTINQQGTVSYTTFNITHIYYSFDEWGYWAKQGDETLFKATNVPGNDLLTPKNFAQTFIGSPTGNNPVSGSATWSGGVRAYESTYPPTSTYSRPVEGDARLEVDFPTATIDVEFSNLTHSYDDMVWTGLELDEGLFVHVVNQPGTPERFNESLVGLFYGDEHQGVAGRFQQGGLAGVFGAIRD